MSTDIFSRNVSFGGVFSADAATLTFTDGSSPIFEAGMLVQNIQWQYQQQVTRLYEISSSAIYLVVGRTQGQASIQKVLGPSALQADFYTTFGDVCSINSNSMTFSARTDCSDPSDGTYGEMITVTLNKTVIIQVGGAVASQDMVVNESLSILFLWLDYAATAS